ncbi:MAG: hypothetical protein ACXAAH_04410, partial [Promethearchaeota archaeon]
MSENQQEEEEKQEPEEENIVEDDLKVYLEEMKTLETDFSDLEDLDMEELQEIQDAISQVRDSEELPEAKEESGDFPREENEVELREEKELKEAMITDFSDMDEIDFDELRDMQEAMSSVKQEELREMSGGENEILATQEVSKELEDRIKQELLKRKEVEEEVVTPKKFLEYIKNKRDKIWYHALYYMVFNIEDNIASKTLLYDVLKDVTSKSPIDPIPEH